MDPSEQSVNVRTDSSRSAEGKPGSEQVRHLSGVELDVMNVAVVITAKLEFCSNVVVEVKRQCPEAAIIREGGDVARRIRAKKRVA
jgi:hypothetical protein